MVATIAFPHSYFASVHTVFTFTLLMCFLCFLPISWCKSGLDLSCLQIIHPLVSKHLSQTRVCVDRAKLMFLKRFFRQTIKTVSTLEWPPFLCSSFHEQETIAATIHLCPLGISIIVLVPVHSTTRACFARHILQL